MYGAAHMATVSGRPSTQGLRQHVWDTMHMEHSIVCREKYVWEKHGKVVTLGCHMVRDCLLCLLHWIFTMGEF